MWCVCNRMILTKEQEDTDHKCDICRAQESGNDQHARKTDQSDGW